MAENPDISALARQLVPVIGIITLIGGAYMALTSADQRHDHELESLIERIERIESALKTQQNKTSENATRIDGLEGFLLELMGAR